MSKERLELSSHEEVRDGVPLRYRVTTVPQHLCDAVVEHMVTCFLPREPMCKSQKLHEDPSSVRAAVGIWAEIVASGAALVAIREGPEEEKDRIVGANLTYIAHKRDEGKPESVVGTKMEPVYDAVAYIGKKANTYEIHGVDAYLSAFGLSVHPDYHGYKVGERLLQAREPLCKAIGINVTGTVFTHPISKYISKKIGFKVVYEEEYSKFTHNGVVLFEGVPGAFEQSVWDFS